MPTITETRSSLSSTYGARVQRSGQRLAGGGSTTVNNTIDQLHMRIAFRLPVKATRLRLHLWNRDVKMGSAVATPGALTLRSAYVGTAAVDAEGQPTYKFAAAPTQISGEVVTPADGASETVGPWTAVDLPVGRDLLLAFGVSSGFGQVHNRSQGVAWYANTWAAATSGPAMIDPGVLSSTSPWYDLWIEYEHVEGASHALILGESLTVGTGSTYPYRDGYASQVSTAQGFAATIAAWHGTNMSADWLNTSGPKWPSMRAVTKPTWIDIGLGSNDIEMARTLAQIQADLGALITALRTDHGDVPVYVRTIMPRGFVTEKETVRTGFNAWLRSRPFGIAGIFDIAALTADPANGTILAAAYNSGDNVHLNTEGYRLIATACKPPLRHVVGAA